MLVKHAVIHQMVTDTQFDKEVSKEQAKKASIDYSTQEHPVDEGQQLDHLLKMLEERLKSGGKGSSRFKNPSDVTGSTGHFKKYLSNDLAFFELTKKLSKRLAAKTPATASGSYLTFFSYDLNNIQYVFVCALKLVDGVTIDANSMQVINATSIRKENIHEGVRINLSDFESHCKDNNRKSNYIDWINRRSSSVLSEYFQQMLDIDTRIENTPQTRMFKSAVDNYIDDVVKEIEGAIDDGQEFEPESVRRSIKNSIYDLVNDRAKQYEELDFEDVDKVISGAITSYDYTHDESFIEFASDNYSDLCNLFKPTRRSTSQWGVIKGVVKSDGVSKIKFEIDRAMLNNKQFFDYDKEQSSITIKKVNDAFFKELK